VKSFMTTALVIMALGASNLLADDKSVGGHIDDTWLHTKVKAAMVGHGSSEVNVEVYKGVVLLAAFVTGEGHKEKLIEAAKSVDGVTKVSDQLHLVKGDRSAGTVVDDTAIAALVKATLVDNDLHDINVEVNRGVVLLSGFVDSKDIREKAVDKTKDLKGVNKVINGMELKT